ncbi:hypothetical protein AVEN_198763-1, partial [Araneus ventricosus]
MGEMVDVGRGCPMWHAYC